MAGCGGGRSGTDRPSAGLAEGLGRAQERAGAGDEAGALRQLLDRAHDPLHRLAAEAAEADRATAARLLAAKQSVERGLAEGTARVADDLGRLEVAARAARAACGRGGSSGEGGG
jgi:hypothetical protein